MLWLQTDPEIAMTGRMDAADQNPQQAGEKTLAAAGVDDTPSTSFASLRMAMRRTVRRPELRKIVPLADTTIYEMEQRGGFPRRFYLTSRCVVWDLAEVEACIEERPAGVKCRSDQASTGARCAQAQNTAR